MTDAASDAVNALGMLLVLGGLSAALALVLEVRARWRRERQSGDRR